MARVPRPHYGMIHPGRARGSGAPHMGLSRGGGGGHPGPPAPGRTGVPRAFQAAGKLGRVASGDPSGGINIRGLQYFLRNKGFDVSVDGKLGPQTRAALRDAVDKGIMKNPSEAERDVIAHVHGQIMGPHNFDAMVHAAGHAPFKPLTGKGGMLTPGGSVSGNPSGGGNGGGGNGSINTSRAQHDIKTATGTRIPLADSNFGNLFNVDKTANAMAQEQFQPQINEQQLQVNEDPKQAAQNMKDIADWYNQVQSGLTNATSSDKAAADAGVDSTQSATQALVQSLGGSANQGAGEAAAAGQNVSGTLQAMGLAQSNLDSTLAPILEAQAAQQKTNQGNIDTQKLTQDQLALQNLQGQEGNAQTNAQMQLESANNSLDQARQQALMNIQQYNNSLAQQKFQNQLGLTDAQIAAEMNGVNIAKSAAEGNYYNAHANLYNSEAQGGGRSASQLNDIGNAIIKDLAGKGMIVSTPSGGYQMAKGYTPAQLLTAARGFGSGYGNLPNNYIGETVLGGIGGY